MSTTMPRLRPLAAKLWTQCPCGAVLPLCATAEYRLCDCGRALRFVGDVQVVESAEDWARRPA